MKGLGQVDEESMVELLGQTRPEESRGLCPARNPLSS